ncbi:MAG: hypothetical protein LV479_00075 [Methylacidiphilales bacterium]|nr:hypothetical protein [Candidatus Methylacidiphilales bacterium]
MRILEVGDLAYLQIIRPESVDFFYIGKKTSEPKPRLTWRDFFELRRRLHAGHYDAVVLSIFAASSPIWRRDRNFISNISRIGRNLTLFHAFGPEIVLELLRGLDVPLIILDRKDDPDRIPSHFLPILARCEKYYWREMPVKLENGFLFTTGRLEDTSAVRKCAVFKENRHKIEPISLGVPWREIYDHVAGEPKTYDVFYAGSTKGSRVRSDGLAQLLELRNEGMRVLIGEEGQPYSFEEYITLCARSWLVWSPEGHGWDCFRHYESCLAHSIPVMNYPRIRRHQPLMEGEHAFYYGVEGDHLKKVIRAALARSENERRAMADRARAHVREHHLDEKIFARIFPAAG